MASAGSSFRRVRAQWSRLGARDPYWAVLTADGTRHDRWDRAAFFASGDAEVDAWMRRLGDLGCEPARHRALDFGCGLGRLTQPLAARFDHADGVDISPTMITTARDLNSHGDRCRYILNDRRDLSILPSGSYDFVYSTLVLQHMPPALARTYIGELIRVMRDDGVLVFQIAERDSSLRSRLTAPIPPWLRSLRTGFEMHGMREADARGLITRAGCRVVDVTRESTPNPRWTNIRLVVQPSAAAGRTQRTPGR